MPFGTTAFCPTMLFVPTGGGVPAGTRLGSPHELTTLPAGSNSTTGGAGLDLKLPPSAPVFGFAPPTPSGAVRPPFWNPRVTTKTWSFASMQVPPTWPRIQPFGSGFGQFGSAAINGAFRPGAASAGGEHAMLPT